jgi:hypothetical protein
MSRRLRSRGSVVSLAVVAVLVATLFVGVAGASAATVRLNGVQTTLTLQPSTAGALLGAGVIPFPVWPTPVMPTPDSLRFSFPITGGMVDATTLVGNINHSGGLLLVQAKKGGGWNSLKLTNFTIAIRTTGAYIVGTVNGGPRVKLLTLDLSMAKITKYMRHGWTYVRIGNVGATLTNAATDAINATFSLSLPRGVKLGTALVVARVAH